MNKRYYALTLLICLIFLVSACKGKSSSSAGGAPRDPFLGGTAGITINFEKDSPLPEVTDDQTFGFKAIVRLKNDGEFKLDRDKIKVNLVGFEPQDFNAHIEDMRNQPPEDSLDARRRDAEGNIVDGTTTFVIFPKGDNEFRPQKFPGNTEFTFRTDVCYLYETRAISKLCILRDMINVRDNSFCKPTGSKTIDSSSAPVQVTNFRQSVIGQNKLSFSFDVGLSGNVDVFQDKSGTTPASSFDNACPREPKKRREVENKVKVKVEAVPISDPFVSGISCGGLDSKHEGVITLVSGKRTLTCTAELNTDRIDSTKDIQVTVTYNVLDSKETKVLVKHLAETS